MEDNFFTRNRGVLGTQSNIYGGDFLQKFFVLLHKSETPVTERNKGLNL